MFILHMCVACVCAMLYRWRSEDNLVLSTHFGHLPATCSSRFREVSDTFFWILQVLTRVCTYPPYICIHINVKINLSQKIIRTFLLIWQLRRWEEGSKVMCPQWMSDLQGEILGSLGPVLGISLPSPAFHPSALPTPTAALPRLL